MLGRTIADPDGIEGSPGETPGLGLLDVETIMTADKSLVEVDATHIGTDTSFSGYEIHIGQTSGPDCDRPFARIGERLDGAQSHDGRVVGSYLHGMFSDDAFRENFRSSLGARASGYQFDEELDGTLDRLAEHLEAHLDVDGLFNLSC